MCIRDSTGVSRKIASDEERQRLKRIVMSERENGHGGFIVRTAAQNAGEDELRADIRFLKGLWNDIKTRAEASKPPALIYHDLNVVEDVYKRQVDAHAEVRAPAGTAGYTQRAPRPQRPGYDRQRSGGGRRGGGRRFPRREPQDVPKISDLLKEGQEILVQIAKEPIGKKGARITSHIALRCV